MNERLVVLGILLAALAAEWVTRAMRWRLLAVVLATLGAFVSQPGTGPAVRRALGASTRVTHWPGRDARPLPPYASGVLTMAREMRASVDFHGTNVQVCAAVLAWLALTPALRRPRPDPAGVDGQHESRQHAAE